MRCAQSPVILTKTNIWNFIF
uniref:Uncharacterized protein n=1 Tax=Anguilla anguilla TaxID=7936 RepID=A0A0E9V3N2_ANGAN